MRVKVEVQAKLEAEGVREGGWEGGRWQPTSPFVPVLVAPRHAAFVAAA